MKDNARATLKTAKAEVAKLTEEVANLEESLTRSGEIAEEAASAIEAFSKLDSEISRYRAESVKAGRDPRALPAALKSKVNARAEAQEELKQAEETRDLLEAELKGARAQLARLNSQLMGYASNVLREFASGLATELFTVSKRYWELQHILSGLNTLQYFDAELKRRVSVGDSEAIGAALLGYSPGQYMATANPLTGMAERWKAQLDAVMADPDAVITELRLVLPSDYCSRQTTAA